MGEPYTTRNNCRYTDLRMPLTVEELNYKISSFVHVERIGTDEKGRLKHSSESNLYICIVGSYLINARTGFIINMRLTLGFN